MSKRRTKMRLVLFEGPGAGRLTLDGQTFFRSGFQVNPGITYSK